MGNNLAGLRAQDFYRDMLLIARPEGGANQGVDATLRPLQDGKGAELPLQVSTDSDNAVYVAGNITVAPGYKLIGNLDCIANAAPLDNDGAASVGTSENAARQDHKHAAPTWTNVTGKPSFATVATSGAYADLLDRPALAAVAITGSYADLLDKPSAAPGIITGTLEVGSGGVTLTEEHDGYVIVATAACTVTLPTAATLSALWSVVILPRGGVVTLARQGADTVAGGASVPLHPPSYFSQARQFQVVRSSSSAFEV